MTLPRDSRDKEQKKNRNVVSRVAEGLSPRRRRRKSCGLLPRARSCPGRAPAGCALAIAGAARPHLVRIVRGLSARFRLGRFPACAGGTGQALALGAGADGDPRKRPDLPARAREHGNHPRRGAGCAGCALGDGGRFKMLRPFRSGRRAVGRPAGARLHRHPPARGRCGAEPRSVLAGPAWWNGEPQRRAHALADCERAEPCQSIRPARFRHASLGCRAVPGARPSARPLGRRS